MKRNIIPYKPYLKLLARKLRNNSTRSEVKLWLCLKGRKMMGYDFHRQKPLLNFIADFYCYELQLVIELDGASHDLEIVQAKDKVKQQELEHIGLTIMRFKDEEVFVDIDGVLERIENYIINNENEKL